eukprot:GGOE01018077.1.p1 GENE.GGOE01018077.1~~GGOE01018077.1.p1  ORF type:complete len:413 (+),score=79.20 GGOE01018077.1:33-1271(+)
MNKFPKVPKPVACVKMDKGPTTSKPDEKALQDAKAIFGNLVKHIVVVFFTYDAANCPERCHLPHEYVIYFYCVVLLCLQQYNICHMNLFAYNWYCFGFGFLALTKRIILKCAQHLHAKAACAKVQGHSSWVPLLLLLATVLYGLLTVLMVLSLWQMMGMYSLWRLHFLAYPCLLYWVWIRPSFISPMDDPSAHACIHMKYWLYSSLCCTYYATVLPLQLVPDPALHYSSVRCIALVLYCLANVAVLLLLQCTFLDLGLNVTLANASLGMVKCLRGSEKKGRHLPHDSNKVVVQCKSSSKDSGWVKTETSGGWCAQAHMFLFQDADHCPRALVILQTIVTFSLLPVVFWSYHWMVYAPILLINYPLLWWTVHVRRWLLVQTLPISRQLARHTQAQAQATVTRSTGPEGGTDPK